MKATVQRALSERQVGEPDVVPFLNKEIVPLLRDIRTAHNLETVQQFTLSTAHTAAFTTIWTSDPMPTNSTWHVRVKCTAITTAGTAQQCAYVREGYFANVAGVVSQVGATASISTFESAAAADVQFAVSGQTILFQVKDDGASTFAWKATVTLLASDEV